MSVLPLHCRRYFSIITFILLSVYSLAQTTYTDTLQASKISGEGSVYLPGGRSFTNREISEAGVVLGRPDLVKILQKQTGISTGMELFNGLYVRGGDGNDNMFILDDVPLYQISHLGGLFSSFNNEIIESLDFYKASFPSRYGERLSSVTDVKTCSALPDKTGGSVSLGLIDGNFRIQGPVIKGKLSYDASFRRSWLDIPARAFLFVRNHGRKEKEYVMYRMYDINLKVIYCPKIHDRLNISFFSNDDKISYLNTVDKKYYGEQIYSAIDTTGFKNRWGNTAASIQWQHWFTDNNRLKLTAYYTKSQSLAEYDSRTSQFSEENIDYYVSGIQSRNHVGSLGFKLDYKAERDRYVLNYGLDVKQSRYVWNNWNSTDSSLEASDGEYSAYADCLYKGDKLFLNMGLRTGAYGGKEKMFYSVQPRFMSVYQMKPGTKVSFSVARMVQPQHLISSVFLDLPSNQWLPSIGKITPSSSVQVDISLNHIISDAWNITFDIYDKKIRNCIIYAGSTSLFPSPVNWEESVAVGEGRSYGAELETRYKSDRIRGVIYYTLSWNKRFFPDLFPEWFSDRLDCRNNLIIDVCTDLNKAWSLNLTFYLHDGNRVTIPEHYLERETGTEILFSRPYNAKFPLYHRLDIALEYDTRTKGGKEVVWNFGIYNAYCHMNPIITRISFEEDGSSFSIRNLALFPIIPSVSYKVKF